LFLDKNEDLSPERQIIDEKVDNRILEIMKEVKEKSKKLKP